MHKTLTVCGEELSPSLSSARYLTDGPHACLDLKLTHYYAVSEQEQVFIGMKLGIPLMGFMDAWCEGCPKCNRFWSISLICMWWTVAHSPQLISCVEKFGDVPFYSPGQELGVDESMTGYRDVSMVLPLPAGKAEQVSSAFFG